MTNQKEHYVHVTDGRGLYCGMKIYMAISEQDAIAQAKEDLKDVPWYCNQWFATTNKKYINSVKSFGKSRRAY